MDGTNSRDEPVGAGKAPDRRRHSSRSRSRSPGDRDGRGRREPRRDFYASDAGAAHARRGDDASDAGEPAAGSACKPVVVIMARTMSVWMFGRMRELVAAGVDAHICVDEEIPGCHVEYGVGAGSAAAAAGSSRAPAPGSPFDADFLARRVHFVPNSVLAKHGYKDLNKRTFGRSMTAWDRAMFWIHEQMARNPPPPQPPPPLTHPAAAAAAAGAATGGASSAGASGSAAGAAVAVSSDGASAAAPASTGGCQWDYVFTVEDDAQWSDAGVLCDLAAHYAADDADLLCGRIADSVAEHPSWPHWESAEGMFSKEHLTGTFNVVMRLSRRMMGELHAFAAEHRRLLYLELIYATLAKARGLSVRYWNDNPLLQLRWRPEFMDAELQGSYLGTPAGFFHPIKREASIWARLPWAEKRVRLASAPPLVDAGTPLKHAGPAHGSVQPFMAAVAAPPAAPVAVPPAPAVATASSSAAASASLLKAPAGAKAAAGGLPAGFGAGLASYDDI